MIYSLFFMTLLLAAATRFYIVRVSSGWFGRGFAGDSSVHFKIIDACRRGETKIPEYVIPNIMSYPKLFHQYCSLFDKQILMSKNYIPNVMLFVLCSGVLYWFSFFNLRGNVDEQTLWAGFGVIVLFLLSVQNLTAFGPSIAYVKLSSRLMGKMSTSFYFLGLITYVSNGTHGGLLLSGIAGMVVFLSSTFGAQAIIFVTLVFALAIFSVTPVILLVVSLLLAVIVSKGYALTSVTSMMRYWLIYKRYVARSRYAADALSRFVSFKMLRNAITSKTPVRAFLRLVLKEPLRGILMYPEVFVLAILLLASDYDSTLLGNTRALIFSTLVVYLLTSTAALNFLGESYRYIEYVLSATAPFAVILLILELSVDADVVCIILVIWVLYNSTLSYFLQRILGYQTPGNVDFLSQFLGEIDFDSDDVVYPITMRLGADIVARINCKSFWWQPGGITNPGMYEKYIHEYPYLSLDWRTLAREHHVTYIIAEKAALAAFHDEYDFTGLQLVKESDAYIAYRAGPNLT